MPLKALPDALTGGTPCEGFLVFYHYTYLVKVAGRMTYQQLSAATPVNGSILLTLFADAARSPKLPADKGAHMSTSQDRDLNEKARFRESLERNRRKLENWPEWMRYGSVGEQLVRETPFEDASSRPAKEERYLQAGEKP
jgi:hypothetical protein